MKKILTMLLVLSMFSCSLSGCSFSSEDLPVSDGTDTMRGETSDNTLANDDNSNETTEDAQQSQNTTIYEDDYVKVDYIDLNQMESIENYIYLSLERLNKTDKTITYRASDGSVNGYAIPLMIENGASVEPGLSHRGTISIPTNNTDVKTPEDVNNIRFKIMIFDAEKLDKIYETDYINIDF